MKTNIYRFLDCSDDGRTILKCDTNFTGDLILPEGIERIADYAFEWCDGLESITFPKSLVSFGKHSFDCCEYLKEISFEEGVKIIGDFCFQNCHSLSEVVLPDSLEIIADYAFSDCYSLKKIVLPSHLKRLGRGAFSACGDLQSIQLSKSIENIEDYTFQGCRSIIGISLPDNIKTIGGNAFEGCFRLESIKMPREITSIGDRAFGCCSSLEEITIPQTVKTLGEGVFDGCCELKSICFMGIVDHIGETYQWLEDGAYSDEDDKFYYGYDLEMNIEHDSFDYQQREGQREYFDNELSYEWSERQRKLQIYVPQGCEWHYFKQLNKEFSPVSGLPSRPQFYNILSIKDENPTYEMYKEKTTEEYIQSESAMAHKVPLITFCQTYGAPKVREYKTLGFTALLCKDEDGEETFISPPKSGNALTLVDFSKSPAEIAAALARNAENLVVLQSNKESDGSPYYTLVDKENYTADGFIKPDYYEEGTSYARQVNKLCSHSFSDIRDISVKFIQEFDDEEIDELFEEINHGMNVLSTNEHLHTYMYCFGLMHEAKLNKAFLEIPKRFFKPSEIEIVDYACGQGIASLCFANFLEDSGHETRIKKITLIEPSTVALSRAALICHKVCPEAIIETIASEFDDLEDDQISTAEVPRVHLLSNILDMTYYDLNHLARVINQVKKKGDLFVCVDPWYHDRKLDGRQRKLMRLSNGKEIYHDVFNAYQLQEDKSWTAYITIFRV